MSKYFSTEFKSPKKFKNVGKSEFNMATLYFEMLFGIMKNISISGANAESSLKPGDIIAYYANLKQYFNSAVIVLYPEEEEIIKNSFNRVKRRIDFFGRRTTNPHQIVEYLQKIQRYMYNTVQERRMIIPVIVPKNPYKEMEGMFGLKK